MAAVRRFCGLIVGGIALAACEPTEKPRPVDPPPETPPAEIELTFDLVPLTFSDIPDWDASQIEAGFSAFRRSCERFFRQDADQPISERAGYGGVVGDYLPACRILPRYEAASEYRRFFEDYFDPFLVQTNDETNKLTGYYEPELKASYKPVGDMTAPIPKRPKDLIEVKLDDFEPSLGSRRIWGKVEGQKLVLYPERADIVTDSDNAIGYATPADVFFLQIQGSGRISFQDGRVVRAGFSAHNHRPFGSLANHLIQTGEISRSNAGMAGIRDWIAKVGPEKAQKAMNINPRFVWFGESEIADPSLGPAGAAGIPLTPMGSMAVDLDKHPLGIPMLIRTRLPERPGKAADEPTNILVTSQDTGGAIIGARRGDLFFGWGDEAGALAGSMNQPGEFYVFLPQKIDATSEPEAEE